MYAIFCFYSTDCRSHSNYALSNVLTGAVVGKVETMFESLTLITYSVQEDDGENVFLLSPLSGEFLLSRSLDFEARQLYVLTVAAQQGSLLVSSVRVYFNVLDVNDNPPVFSQDIFHASLLEDVQVGTCFLPLNVSDKDEGKWSSDESYFFTFCVCLINVFLILLFRNSH